MRYEIRPLGQWTDPVTAARKSSGVFQASWDDTLVLLRDEVERLDGEYPIVIQIDVTELDLRQDGMLRSKARVGPNPGAVVSFQSRFGPLRYATDAYEQRWTGALPGWQANVRAIALALEALRAVDRYGVSRRGEQYTGWKALPAGSGAGTSPFATTGAALQWMRAQDDLEGGELAPGALYRKLARRMHPDIPTGNPADWDKLDAARRILQTADML
jgi:hypothetical protein